MDVLKFIALLPLKIVNFLRFILVLILHFLGFMLRPVIGTWQPPKWSAEASDNFDRMDRWADENPYKASAIIFTVALLFAGGAVFYHWHASHPQNYPTPPEMTVMRLDPPNLRDFTDESSKPQSLTVNFNKSAAPIENVDKEITEGIKINPHTDGVWRWESDSAISFYPKTDWLPGETYTISINPAKLLAPQVQIKDTRASFTNIPLQASVNRSYFYTDPVDPALQRAIAEISFNYPVDPAQFEKRVELTLREPGKKDGHPAFSVTYDEFKMNAVIQSAPLSMPEKAGVVVIDVKKGIASPLGGNGTDSGLSAEVTVPSLYSLSVNSIEATLVNNPNNEPEQIILVETSNPVQDKSLNSKIKAWILPEPEEKEGGAWHDGNITDKVLEKSTELKLAPVPSEEEYSSLHSYRFQAKPGEQLYVKIDKDIKSFSGYKLPAAAQQVLEVPEFSTLLDFVSEGSLLSMSGDHKFTVVSRNIKGIRVTVKRVLPGQIQHMVSQNRWGSYSTPQLDGSLFNEDNISKVFEAKIPISNPDPVKPHYEGIDLSPYFGEQGKKLRGVFVVTLQQYDPDEELARAAENATQEQDQFYGEKDFGNHRDDEDDNDYSQNSVKRLIVVTDLGVIAKTAHDNSRNIYVQSIHSGQPVEGAKVEVLALNGEVLHSATTGKDGHAALPSLEEYTRERKPTLFLVSKGDDSSFLPVNESGRYLSYSRFNTSGESTPEPGALRADLFSDRGIYRPGDTFNVGIIVRAFDWAKPLEGLPFKLCLYDPRGQLVQSSKISFSQEGFEEYSYTTRPTDATGEWEVCLYLVKDEEEDTKSFVGYTTVEIKEFLPDRMQVKAAFNAEKNQGWVKPDGLNAQVNVQNLFGSPAQNRRIEGEITLRPALPSFAGYPDYTFRSRNENRDGLNEELPEQTSNEQGDAVFDLNLGRRIDGTYQLHFLCRAYEQGSGRNVSAQASVMVSPEDFLVGIKADGDLDYVERGAARNLNLVAVDPELRKTGVDKLKLVIKEKKYLSVLTKDQYSGLYSYVSKLRVDELSSKDLSIPAGGQNLPLPTGRPGNFVAQIQNSEGQVLNWVEYSVAGDANVTRSLERSAELQLKLNKQVFEAGEEIEVSINAPYTGSGLITIERDKVYAHTWFTSPTTSSVQKIRVPEGFVGNGYVNVQFVRDPGSSEIFISPLSYGVLPFSTTLDSKRASLEVKVPELLKPGDNLTMKVITPQPEKVIVFAVDEGILQVARYVLRDPLDTLMPKRRLEVKTSQILDLILPMFKTILAESAPGGDAYSADANARQLNPFARKADAPVSYWSGIISVDGEKELTYKVPDYFNGKIRVMAVAVTPSRVGISQASTTVRDDFIMTPNVPAMVTPGDSFEISLGISNNMQNQGGQPIPVTISLNTEDGLEKTGAASATVTLAEKQEGMVTFQLKATEKLGASRLTFTASYGDKTSRRSAEVSVRPVEAFRTEVKMGRMDSPAIQIKPLREMYDEFAVRDISASYVPLVLARGLSSYLINYPHYCSEQLISAAIPYLVQQQHPEFRLIDADQEKGREVHKAVLAALSTRQNASGGIGNWKATPEVDPFVTAYALHYMLELKSNNIAVPESLLQNANNYLNAYASNPAYNDLPSLRLKAYIAYLTARQEQIPTNLLAAVNRDMNKYYPEELKSDLTGAYMAATYKILKQDKEADALIEYSLKELNRKNYGKWYDDGYYDNLVRDASMLYLIQSHFPKQALALAPEALENIARPLIENRFTTLSSSMCMLALNKYAGHDTVQQGEISILQADGPDMGKARVISEVTGLLSSASFNANAKALLLNKSVPLPAWYAMEQSGFDLKASDSPIKNGLEVTKEYYDSKGEPVSEVKLGQEIFVLLKVRSTSEEAVGGAVLVDLIPGGFELVPQYDMIAAVPPNIRSLKSLALNHREEREDRDLIYCTARPKVSSTYYVIRATNAGEFAIPALYGESMYDRAIQARTPGGKTIKVIK